MRFKDLLERPEEEADNVTVIPPATGELLDDETGEKALMAMIPLQSGNSNKYQYLAWRTMGFGVKEACDLIGITIQTVHHWKRTDPNFAKVEQEHLKELQKEHVKSLQLLWFSRNMALVYHIDNKILRKAASRLEALRPVEYDWIKSAQSRYNPKNLVDLERALGPEIVDQTNINAQGNVVIVVDGRQVDSEAARRAGARELLDRFRVNKQSLTELTEQDDSDDPGSN